jgi:hypothetical protein
MEDDLNIFEIKDNINLFGNGRQHQFTLFGIGRQPQFF